MEISAFVALFVSVLVKRVLFEKGYRTLNEQEKLRLMDGFSDSRMYAFIPLVVIVLLYFYLATQTSLDRGLLTIGYFACLLPYVLFRVVRNQQILRKLAMPPLYIRYFTIGQAISLLGFAWFLFAINQNSKLF